MLAGRRPPTYPGSLAKRIASRAAALPSTLAPDQHALEVERIKAEKTAAEGRIARPVAGFDLTFSVPKSVSTVWALADPATQAVIYAAHRDAIQTALGWAEEQVFFSRTGAGGAVQEPVLGCGRVRSLGLPGGDPHLHTHVVVANRAQTADGQWRTLNSRTLHKYVVALSELHEGVLRDLLTDWLGYGWSERARRRSPVPRHDIAGVPNDLLEEFSQRAQQIETDKTRLVAVFAATHGRQPSSAEVPRLRQQATLQTRPDKQHQSLADLVDQWRQRAFGFISGDTETWARHVQRQSELPALTAILIDPVMHDELAALALSIVSSKRATFTHANVLAEVHRQLHGARFSTPAERLTVADRATGLALAQAVHLNLAPATEPLAPELRRPDGTSKLVHRGSELFSTPAILAAEQSRLDAADNLTAPGLSTAEVAYVLGFDPAGALSADQTAAVIAIAISGRALDLLIGPAGTGKTTTLRTLRTAWQQAYVVGLAPSAAAADVLTNGSAFPPRDTAKWLHEHTRTPERDARVAALDGDSSRPPWSDSSASTASSKATRSRHVQCAPTAARTVAGA